MFAHLGPQGLPVFFCASLVTGMTVLGGDTPSLTTSSASDGGCPVVGMALMSNAPSKACVAHPLSHFPS